MNQHLHSLACVTDVYLKIIDVETHSRLEPAAAKLGRADKYISNINGSLWRCCLRGRTLGLSLPPQTHIVPSVKVCVISEGVVGLWPSVLFMVSDSVLHITIDCDLISYLCECLSSVFSVSSQGL